MLLGVYRVAVDWVAIVYYLHMALALGTIRTEAMGLFFASDPDLLLSQQQV